VFEIDGIYHLMSRGSNRQALFRYDGDRVAFIDRMDKVGNRYGVRWIAYCLMGNHYHAIVQPHSERLSDAMRDLHGGFSRLLARVYGSDAHLFKNRFLAEQIDTLEYFATAMRYVHLNPVRAGLCGHPADWPWSSYRATVGLDPQPSFIAPEVFLRIDEQRLGSAQSDYAAFVEAGIANAVSDTGLRPKGEEGLVVRRDRVESAA
jgi:REP element-mobilizing transposase RayT